MTAALNDDAHAEEQRARYAARRAGSGRRWRRAGWAGRRTPAAGLYLWAVASRP